MNNPDLHNIDRLASLIADCDNFIITAHMRPDGDAMGSTLALMRFLRGIGKEARIVLPDMYPANLAFMTGEDEKGLVISASDQPEAAGKAADEAGLIFCLDFNTFAESRCGALSTFLQNARCGKVLIDHHLYPEKDLFLLMFSETSISSTSELLFWILMAMPQTGGNPSALTRATAEALFTGMTTDTNNFANSVYASTLKMASLLIDAGTDRDAILGHLYNEYKESRLRLLGKLLQEMKITADGAAYMILDKATMDRYGIEEGDTEGFVNMPLSIDRVKLSIFVKEDKGFLRVSLRSKKGISANRCAREYFNGGGHEQASGGRLRIPEDIGGIADATSYIEHVTHIFMDNANGQE